MNSSFRHIKKEDTIFRMLAGCIPMKLRVSKIDDSLIHAVGGWTFNRDTGVEIDEFIPSIVSYLVHELPEAANDD